MDCSRGLEVLEQPEAQEAMGGGFEKEYIPDPSMARVYASLYEKYKRLGDYIELETTKEV